MDSFIALEHEPPVAVIAASIVHPVLDNSEFWCIADNPLVDLLWVPHSKKCVPDHLCSKNLMNSGPPRNNGMKSYHHHPESASDWDGQCNLIICLFWFYGTRSIIYGCLSVFYPSLLESSGFNVIFVNFVAFMVSTKKKCHFVTLLCSISSHQRSQNALVRSKEAWIHRWTRCKIKWNPLCRLTKLSAIQNLLWSIGWSWCTSELMLIALAGSIDPYGDCVALIHLRATMTVSGSE